MPSKDPATGPARDRAINLRVAGLRRVPYPARLRDDRLSPYISGMGATIDQVIPPFSLRSPGPVSDGKRQSAPEYRHQGAAPMPSKDPATGPARDRAINLRVAGA